MLRCETDLLASCPEAISVCGSLDTFLDAVEVQSCVDCLWMAIFCISHTGKRGMVYLVGFMFSKWVTCIYKMAQVKFQP